MIELKNVCKNYGLTKALVDVSFSIKKGEIIGFVGPNGAGKSTAMKIITTYTAPTSGSIQVGDFDVMENPLDVRKMIGYLPETVPLYYDMMVSEYLEFIGEARHLNGTFKQRYDWVVESCGLSTVLNRKIGVLSKGFKQRTCLAQALIHDPDVLILDEPTSGLDPLQIIGIRNLIKDLAHSKTIILSTHILPEVSTVADRILVINEGQLVADGTFDDLVKKVTDKNSVYLSVKTAKKDFESAIQKIKGIQDISYESASPRGVVSCHISYGPGEDIVKNLNDVIRSEKWDITAFQQEAMSLEESFIRLTQAPSKESKAKEGGSV